MYVATFYSFKGGVGRTLALVNVAFGLAHQGHRVLMVDFDLEAPGLSSFEFCGSSRQTPGVIDFVLSYLEQGETPKISDYIVDCSGGGKGGGALFMMPAGKGDDTYGRRLASIDWTDLYRHQRGYLMMEDMKQQWADELNPDYVLVDSRTGYTEEGGICTRQLPDAVVVMFFPNEQNLLGLRKVVRDIRTEAKSQDRDISLHFATSNIPDLDDEDRILSGRLDRFKEELGFNSLLTVHHYPSLALLNQEIFAVERPRSRLAQEYFAILNSLAEGNPADKRGALSLLRRIRDHEYEVPPSVDGAEFVRSKLDRIMEAHPQDSEIALKVASIYIEVGDIQKAGALLDRVVEARSYSVELFRLRYFIHSLQGESAAGTNDLLKLLELHGVRGRDALFAFQGLSDRCPERLYAALELESFKALPLTDRLRIGKSLMGKPNALGVAETIFRAIISEEPEQKTARVNLSLCLINAQRYDEVMQMLGPRDRLFGEGVELPDIFNFAMAEWGAFGKPSSDLLDRFLESAPSDKSRRYDPNFFQCMAISYGLLHRTQEAKAALHDAQARIDVISVPAFSAWRYLVVSPTEFRADLGAIDRLINGAPIKPDFMEGERRSEV